MNHLRNRPVGLGQRDAEHLGGDDVAEGNNRREVVRCAGKIGLREGHAEAPRQSAPNGSHTAHVPQRVRAAHVAQKPAHVGHGKTGRR